MSDDIRIENVKEFLDTLTKDQLMYLRWRLYEFADIDSIQNGMINNNDIFSLNNIPDNNEINNPFNGLSKHEYIQNLYNNDKFLAYKITRNAKEFQDQILTRDFFIKYYATLIQGISNNYG